MKKLLLLPLLFLSFAQAETIQCKVVGVHDGDSITCLTENKEQIKVRLFGVDAPELDQAYGEDAKQALYNIVYGEKIKIEGIVKNKEKWVLGTVKFITLDVCILPQIESEKKSSCFVYGDANLSIIRDGYAWHYPFDTKNPEYIQAEQEAREAKRGLWADKNPIAPWEWRKQKKGKK